MIMSKTIKNNLPGNDTREIIPIPLSPLLFQVDWDSILMPKVNALL